MVLDAGSLTIDDQQGFIPLRVLFRFQSCDFSLCPSMAKGMINPTLINYFIRVVTILPHNLIPPKALTSNTITLGLIFEHIDSGGVQIFKPRNAQKIFNKCLKHLEKL